MKGPADAPPRGARGRLAANLARLHWFTWANAAALSVAFLFLMFKKTTEVNCTWTFPTATYHGFPIPYATTYSCGYSNADDLRWFPIWIVNALMLGFIVWFFARWLQRRIDAWTVRYGSPMRLHLFTALLAMLIAAGLLGTNLEQQYVFLGQWDAGAYGVELYGFPCTAMDVEVMGSQRFPGVHLGGVAANLLFAQLVLLGTVVFCERRIAWAEEQARDDATLWREQIVQASEG